MEQKTDQLKVSFAAIDPYIETNIVLPTESVHAGAGWISWGEGNAYPEYLLDLCKNVSTLRSIITGTVDFITGDDITIQPLVDGRSPGVMNAHRDTIREQVHDIATDFEQYGGFALQVIRSSTGKPVEIYYIDLRFLRSNKDNTVFYYSEKWGKTGRKVIEYPSFRQFTAEEWAALDEDARNRNASSILFVKNVHTQVYPVAPYAAAVKACETERCIDDFHLNAINNGFVSSLIVNFNNGVPSDEMKEEIEKSFNEKFSGHQNAGRIMFSWNPDRTAATTITEPKVENFGDRYNALAKHCRQQIFTAFRANPNLFGIPTENLGFSQEEYESAFRLYNRTCVKPVQRLIVEAYERIYGETGVMSIKPFSLEETATEQNVN